jgi:hypothetical protein
MKVVVVKSYDGETKEAARGRERERGTHLLGTFELHEMLLVVQTVAQSVTKQSQRSLAGIGDSLLSLLWVSE